MKVHRRIFLKDFELIMSIGIHDFELEMKQRILVDVDLLLSPAPMEEIDDHISSVLDYDFLREEIRKLTDKRHYNLQEVFCHDIIRVCLARGGVERVKVSTRKPDVYHDCGAVGYEADVSVEEND
jgi:7,8-dihydroneopterin aldolase/epimerase/oxygenase